MNKSTLAFSVVLLALCSTLLLPQQVNADDSASASVKLSRQMQHQVIKGRFEQLRHLTGIPRPIRSSGRFIYWRDHGLYWETQKPIAQASTFTADAIIHWQATSRSPQVEQNSSPIQQQVSRILLAVFGGDIQSLESLFDSHGQSESKAEIKQWTVELIPTMDAVKQVVEKISLSGEDYIQRLSLNASNGDSTQIQFSTIRVLSHPGDDCRYFENDASLCPADKSLSNQREP